MPYIGNPIYQSAFVTDQFSGDGSTTAFTMSVAPAGVTNVLVAVSGVLQDPSTYGVTGTTITFSTAPPSGTGNISCRYLGIPVTGIVTTAYRTVTEFTATASQTTFTPPSYTVGYINVYRNGVLLGSADYTATNGTTVVLATGATAGDLVTVESFRVESVLNAISNSAGSVGTSNLADSSVTTAKIAAGAVVEADLATDSVTTVKIVDTNVTAAKLANTLDLSSKSVTLPGGSFSPIFVSSAATGSSVVFGSIPSWVKTIRIATSGVQVGSSAEVLFRLGTASGIETSGYNTISTYFQSGSTNNTYSTDAFKFANWFSTANIHNILITLQYVTANIWVATGNFQNPTYNDYFIAFNGQKSLSGVLTQVSIAPSTGNFSAGTIAISYQ